MARWGARDKHAVGISVADGTGAATFHAGAVDGEGGVDSGIGNADRGARRRAPGCPLPLPPPSFAFVASSARWGQPLAAVGGHRCARSAAP